MDETSVIIRLSPVVAFRCEMVLRDNLERISKEGATGDAEAIGYLIDQLTEANSGPRTEEK